MVPISVTDGSKGLAMQLTETEERRKEFAMKKKTTTTNKQTTEWPIALL